MKIRKILTKPATFDIIKKNMKTVFISFEGPEGAGKSTALAAVLPELTKYHEVVATREPGGVRIAESIREIILDRRNTSIDGKTEMLLFAAARRIHLLEKIKPALEAGKVVLVDRYIDSSVAYQGTAGGLEVSDVKWLNDFATDGLKPDLTLYFDLSPEIGLARVMKDDAREKNRLDLAALAYHKQVVSGYLQLCKEEPKRFVKIDATQSEGEVSKEILSVISSRFPNEFGMVGGN